MAPDQRAVVSRAPKVSGQPMTAPQATPRGHGRIVGLFALIIGGPLWLEGARFTRDGWILFIDWLMARFAIPFRVPPLTWQAAIVSMLALGIAYSYIELVRQPIRFPRNLRKDFFRASAWRVERVWEVWIVWLVLVISDIGTTFAGAQTPAPGDLALLLDIARSSLLLAIYAILITFVPDRLIRYGWRVLRKG